MKYILFICLLICFNCNEVIDAGKCLLDIPNFKEEIKNVLESIKTRNVKEILKVVEIAFQNIKDDAIDCINKIHSLNGLICKQPINNLKCLISCGLPDDSPRYYNCYKNCRENFCL